MKEIIHNYIYLFYGLGYFGDSIAFIIMCIILLNRPLFFIFYIIFVILNILLNEYLTNKIKEKNPKDPIKFLASDFFSKKRFGMPSIHSQNIFFSIMYCYLVIKNILLIPIILLLLGFLVIYERYMFRDHTIKQLIYGAVLGLIIGYTSYYIVFFIQYIFSIL